jgi:hypothetical protein
MINRPFFIFCFFLLHSLRAYPQADTGISFNHQLTSPDGNYQVKLHRN